MGIYGYTAHSIMEGQNLNEGFFSDLKKKREEKKAEKERSRKEAADKTVLEYLNKTLKYAKSPFTLGDGYDSEVLIVLHKLGMKKDDLEKFFMKNHSQLKKTIDYTGNLDKYYEDLSKASKEKVKNSVAILENDDYILLFCLSDNKLYELIDNLTIFSFGNYNELNVADWSDYKEVSKNNGDILGQIQKIVSR